MGSATLTMSRREGFLRRVLLVGADFLEDVNKGLEAYLQSARENAIQRTTSTVRATTEEVTERLTYLFQNATTTTVQKKSPRGSNLSLKTQVMILQVKSQFQYQPEPRCGAWTKMSL